jgi:hypothetical protein
MTEQKAQYATALTKVNDTFFPLITNQFENNNLKMDDYAKTCVMSAISAINTVLDSKGIKWSDAQLDKSNITQTLMTVASLKLNAAASPREVYFLQRNVKRKEDGKDVWIKQVEMGLEGDGNDAILSNFGRGVKTVHQFWLVREDDGFTYPTYRGLDMEPPTWSPKGKGKVVRVVYPITKTTGEVDYYIAEREDVTRNLYAHIANNMMNETFGIAESRFKATPKQKGEIDAKKAAFLTKIKAIFEEKGIDGVLDDPEISEHVSPAWKEPQSREAMIIRKMRNNVVKKIPKDFGNAFIEMSYEENTDAEYARARKDVSEHANQELVGFKEDEPEQPKQQPKQQKPKPDVIIDVQDEPIVEEPKKESPELTDKPDGVEPMPWDE